MQRPVSVTVFGILNFVFAALGGIGLIASFAVFAVPVNSNDSIIKLMHQGPAYAAWLKICIPLGILSCVLLLATGVGLLSLKSWARPLSIACAIYVIVFTVAGMIVNLLLMAQPFFHTVGYKQQLVAACAVGGPLSGTLGGIFWVIYPIVLLVFMLSPKMVAAFRPALPLQTQEQPAAG